MDTSNPLATLKAIHLPAPVSFWPLAFGWYVVALAILILAIVLAVFFIKQHKKRQKRKEIFRLLNEFESNTPGYLPHQVLDEVSVFLKRVSVTQFPKLASHELYGEQWLDFLDKTGKTNQFSQGPGRILLQVYKGVEIENPQPFFEVLRQWLRKVL